MAMLTHVERMQNLRAAVDTECIRRWEKFKSRSWSEDERIRLNAIESEAAYGRSRDIEAGANQHWRNLERVLGQCEKFLATCDADLGSWKAAQLAKAVPKMRIVFDHAPDLAAPTGAAVFSAPSRKTFVRDRLRLFARGCGLDDPFKLKPQILALMTLLSTAFFPYSQSAQRRFERSGYPKALDVIRKETEVLRKLTSSR